MFEHLPYEPVPQWYEKHAKEGICEICRRISAAFELSEADSKRIVGFFWAAMHGVSAIFLNRKMEMVAELFNADSLDAYMEYCLDGLLKEISDAQLQ